MSMRLTRNGDNKKEIAMKHCILNILKLTGLVCLLCIGTLLSEQQAAQASESASDSQVSTMESSPWSTNGSLIPIMRTA
jgi:hypothetical protein